MTFPQQGYFLRIAKARYFWLHLVRSFLGIAWATLHPLCLTLLLGFVMGRVFHSPLAEYAPFILSGLILWEFIITSAVTGCHAFLNAEGYIRQFVHPLAIYSLRTTLACIINFCFAFIGLFAWIMLSKPNACNASWLSLPLAFSFLFIIGWSLATITALITVRFRDFSQMIVLLLQAVWYISPIFILPSVFEQVGIPWIVRYNPVYHLFCLFRAPLLQGNMPSLTSYAYVAVTMLLLVCSAMLFLKNAEKRVIFYL
jgi:lipopolysaccharide transport system permease protein